MHTKLENGDSISHGPNEKLYVKAKSVYLGAFSIMFDYAMTRATKEAYEATPTLNILISHIERENLVRLRPNKIAQILGVSPDTVNRHLKKLHSLQLILPDDAEDGRSRAIFNWRVCPFLSWKGGTDTLNTYLKKLPENHAWLSYAELQKEE